MGLFDFLLGGDITRDWVAEPNVELEFNFDEFSLCGVRLGDRAEQLSQLGPVEDPRAVRKGSLRYFSLGLELEVQHDLIEAIVLVWAWPNDFDSAYQSFLGICKHHGRIWPLHRETTFLDFTAHFGEPDRREDDEFGLVFVYTFDKVQLEIEFDELDLLSTLIVRPRE